MSTYTDNNKKSWSIEIDIKTLKDIRKKVKDETGKPVDLLSCLTGDLSFKLINDPVLLADILWTIVESQAKTAAVVQEQFIAAHRGDVLACAADALMEGIADFFPKPTAEKLRMIYQQAKTIREKALKTMVESLDKAAQQIQPMELPSSAEFVSGV